MTRARELADLLTGGQTISTDGNTAQLTLESTDADANLGPLLAMHRNSASPADSDVTGKIEFNGEDSAGNATVYASINSSILDVTNGTEDGELKFEVRNDGSNTEILTLTSAAAMAVPMTITTADNDAQLTLKSTDADANVGPVLDLHRDSSSPADNDVLGILNFKGENDASEIISYASINGYIKDATDGSEDGRVIHRVFKDGTNINLVDMKSDEVVFNEDSQDINFRVESDGNANMFIVDGGNNSVMVGDNTGASYSDGGLFTRHAGGANNSPFCVVNGTTSGVRRMIDFFVGTSTSRVGSIQSDDAATGFNTSSDYRMKENVADMTGAIDRVKALAPKRFNFIVKPNTIVDGFLAHEVSSIVPEAISGEKDEVATWGKEEKLPDGVKVGDNKLDDNGNTIPIMQGIDHSKLVPLLTGALREAIAKIETLETKVAALEAE